MPIQEIHLTVTSLICDACNRESRGFDQDAEVAVKILKAEGWSVVMEPALTPTGRRQRSTSVIRYYCKPCTKRKGL